MAEKMQVTAAAHYRHQIQDDISKDLLAELKSFRVGAFACVESWQRQLEMHVLSTEQRLLERLGLPRSGENGMGRAPAALRTPPASAADRQSYRHDSPEASMGRAGTQRSAGNISSMSGDESVDSACYYKRDSEPMLFTRAAQHRSDPEMHTRSPRKMRIAFRKWPTDRAEQQAQQQAQQQIQFQRTEQPRLSHTGVAALEVRAHASMGYTLAPTLTSTVSAFADAPLSGSSARNSRHSASGGTQNGRTNRLIPDLGDNGTIREGTKEPPTVSTSVPVDMLGASVIQNSKDTTERHQELIEEQPLFELCPLWLPGPGSRHADRMTPSHFGSSTTRQLALEAMRRPGFSGDSMNLHHSYKMGHCVLSPFSHWFLMWNFLFAIVLTYEVISLPMGAFEMPEDGFYHAAQWFTAVFWTADILVSCASGYLDSTGRVVLDNKMILKHYARSWMIPDIVLITLHWIMLADLSGGWARAAAGLRLGKSLRYLRILRLARLLRLRRLTEAMHSLDDLMNSQACTIGKSIVVNLFTIIVIAHFVACLWYAIGKTHISGYGSWVSEYGFNPADWEYVYWVSLHWSLTQFTPGSMTVQPQNALESFYAVVVLILGLIIFSSIIGSITTATNNLRNMNAWYGKQIWLLRKYFREKGISFELLARVTRFSDAVIQPRQKQVNIDDVRLIPLLPESMRMEVFLELYRPKLEVHPFFMDLIHYSRTVMQKVCHTALTELVLDLDDVLFSPGQISHCMYFFGSGLLSYQMDHVDLQRTWPHEEDGDESTRDSWHWCCEPVLWTTSWLHQGRMTALSEAELIALSADTFQKVVNQHKTDAVFPRKYAQHFVQNMNKISGSGEMEVLSDLMAPGSFRFSNLLAAGAAQDLQEQEGVDFDGAGAEALDVEGSPSVCSDFSL